MGNPTQSWQFPRQLDGYYEIINVGTGTCLSIYYAQTTTGAPLVQYDCHGWQDQKWALLPDYANGFSIESVMSFKVVDVPGGTTKWWTQLDQWPYNAATNQLFTLTPL